MSGGGKRQPGLAVVLVGNYPASQIYCPQEAGSVRGSRYRVARPTICRPTRRETIILALIDELNADPTIHGILGAVSCCPRTSSDNAIDRTYRHPIKDVQGFHPYTVGRFAQCMPVLAPLQPQHGIMTILNRIGEHPKGRSRSIVVGASNHFGSPTGPGVPVGGNDHQRMPSVHAGPACRVQRARILAGSQDGKPNLIPAP